MNSCELRIFITVQYNVIHTSSSIFECSFWSWDPHNIKEFNIFLSFVDLLLSKCTCNNSFICLDRTSLDAWYPQIAHNFLWWDITTKSNCNNFYTALSVNPAVFLSTIDFVPSIFLLELRCLSFGIILSLKECRICVGSQLELPWLFKSPWKVP